MAACAPRAELPGEPFGATATELLQAVNAERARGAVCGGSRFAPAPRLALERRLTRAAELHTHDMLTNGFLGHVGTDGSTVGQRATRQGYAWWAVGENVAMGYGSVQDVMQAWMESPSHCSALMEPSFTELGGAEQGGFWTLVFGQPR